MINMPHYADNRRPDLRVLRHFSKPPRSRSDPEEKIQFLVHNQVMCHASSFRNCVQSHLLCNGHLTLLIITL